MAAFRLGKISESHEILLEICQHLRHKELLAQQVSNYQNKSHEFEVEEARRQIPYHMRIDLKVLDTFYCVSSMLLEIPNFAEN